MLTSENYFSIENNMEYMSTSQFKTFMECESMALAEVKGEFVREKTTSMLVGSYVDAHYEKTLDLFKAKNPEIFTQKGELKSEYKHAEYITQRLERDPMFQSYMSGEKQVIMTGEILGVPFKIKMDSYFKGERIVDLKIMKDFEQTWKDGLYVSFVENWGYDIQAAIYQFVEGNNLPFIIAGATKEKPEPNLEIISIPQNRIDYCLDIVTDNVQRFADIKKGLVIPARCGKCNYCKSTKVLTEVVEYSNLA